MVSHSHNMRPTRCAWRSAKLKSCGQTRDIPSPLVTLTYPALYQLEVGVSKLLNKQLKKCLSINVSFTFFINKVKTKENMKRKQINQFVFEFN